MADEDLEAGAENVNLDEGEGRASKEKDDAESSSEVRPKRKLKLPLGLTPVTLAIGVLALVSVVLSVGSFMKAQSYRARYETALQAARDPANLGYYRERNLQILESNTYEPGRALIVYGSDLGHEWSALEILRGDLVVNRSIANQTLDQLLLRYAQDVIDLQPAAVLMLPPVEAAVRVDWMMHEIRVMAELAVESGIQPILATIAPIPEDEDSIAGGYVGRIRAANRRLQELCLAKGWTCFDVFALLAGDDHYLRSDYAHDDLWPNAHGYGEMTRALEAMLDTVRAAPLARDAHQETSPHTASR